MFTFFGGVGFNVANSNYKMLGNFPIYVTNSNSTLSLNIEDVVDPIDTSSQYNRLKAEFGFRVDYNRYYIQMNYTKADYGGIGLNLGARF